ncbi:MAG: hypothetical protein IJF87_02215 [Erysipelotrichaceae bacterium]|nr:hypothetical protein [Erysipelotrichaceae bacterium]
MKKKGINQIDFSKQKGFQKHHIGTEVDAEFEYLEYFQQKDQFYRNILINHEIE